MNMLLSAVLIIVAVNLHNVHSQLREGESCRTPNSETATCVSLYSCPIFITALKNRKSDTVQFVRQSTCGFDDKSNPLVCCGTVAGYQQVTRPTPTTSSSRPPTQPTDPVIGPVNNRLLPSRDECGNQVIANRIIGGNVTKLDEFPWMALLEYEKNGRSVGFSCGGMLISQRYVLTAAHCIVGSIVTEVGNLFRIRLGEFDTRTNPDCVEDEGCNINYQDINVEEQIAHTLYTQNRNDKLNRFHDIGLVRLSRPVMLDPDFVQPICLPTNGESSRVGAIAHVAGWGTISPLRYVASPVKLKVNVSIFDPAECVSTFKKLYRVDIGSSQLCAGGAKLQDSCNGDSGGPLMQTFPTSEKWYAEGIVSYGPKLCGTENVPGIYTKISDYLGWISQNMHA